MCQTAIDKETFPGIAQLAAANKVYLDSAATAQKPNVVLQAMHNAAIEFNFPVNRSFYPAAATTAAKVDQVRAQVLQHFKATDDFTAIFCASATDALNLLASGLKPCWQSFPNNILLTTAEHHSNIAPWLELAASTASTVNMLPLPTRGFFQAKDFALQINVQPVGLLAITLDSNVLGPVWQPDWAELQAVIQMVHAQGGLVVLDASQAIAYRQIDLALLDADFLVFSGHKFGAPHGIGALIGKTKLLANLQPMRVGGGNISQLDDQNYTLAPLPERLEAGSLPNALIIGLGAALDFLTQQLLPCQPHVTALCQAAIAGLQQLAGIRILGNAAFMAHHGHMVSFVHSTIPVHDLAWSLGQAGVYVRAGFHCAQPLHRQLQANGSVRASFFAYNSMQDVQRLLSELRYVLQFFGEQ